jgi:hypothetical protein
MGDLVIMDKLKYIIKDLIPCSQGKLSVEEAYKIAKDTEDIYLNSNLNDKAALRQAITKFNKEKGERR